MTSSRVEAMAPAGGLRPKDIRFASCYVYSPAGAGVASERSRLLRSLLKEGDAHFMDRYVDRVRQQVAEPSLAGFFCSSTVLVPIPGCSPRVRGGRAIADMLASALFSEGLGHSVWRGLHRVSPVRKSATAAPGSRPTVAEHYHSFLIEPLLEEWPGPRRIVLVDDVVTKGRTLLAAAARMRDAFPDVDIRAFALVRTMGLVSGVARLLDPCVGEIRWEGGDAYRTP